MILFAQEARCVCWQTHKKKMLSRTHLGAACAGCALAAQEVGREVAGPLRGQIIRAPRRAIELHAPSGGVVGAALRVCTMQSILDSSERACRAMQCMHTPTVTGCSLYTWRNKECKWRCSGHAQDSERVCSRTMSTPRCSAELQPHMRPISRQGQPCMHDILTEAGQLSTEQPPKKMKTQAAAHTPLRHKAQEESAPTTASAPAQHARWSIRQRPAQQRPGRPAPHC